VTKGNAAAIPDSDSGGAVGADDAVDAVVSVVGTGNAGVISTYY
jgi:hypothetical protein